MWADRAKGRVLALLQDRVGQVSSLAERCRSALSCIYRALFPLNVEPEGLRGLLARFGNMESVKDAVRAQLIGGAKVALAFARVHYPGIDLRMIGKGLPPVGEGDRVPMNVHYAAARGPAQDIISRVEIETDLEVQRRQLLIPKEEPQD